MSSTTGARFRKAMAEEKPLQIPGTINAYTALLAQREGYRAIYLSGAGVANASYGMPDLGMTSMSDVLVDIERITSACAVPLLVDADTGWGHSLCISRTIQAFIKAGAAAVHIEDQQAAKRCGHRPNKAMVSTGEMVDRLHAAVDARTDESFVIMARTDALAEEGLERSIERCQKYIEAGADVIFAEAITDAEHYRFFTQSLSVPVLANMTEFGMSPLMTVEHLSEVGVELVLYPLTAFRVMSQAASAAYQTIRKTGTQSSILDQMQTRKELYEVLDYHAYEQKIDDLLKKADSE
jgi:methylisocitrate lyase